LYCFIIVLNRFLIKTDFIVGIPPIEVGFGIIRFQQDGPIIVLKGMSVLTEAIVSKSPAQVGRVKIRPNAKSLVIIFDSLLEIPFFSQMEARLLCAI